MENIDNIISQNLNDILNAKAYFHSLVKIKIIIRESNQSFLILSSQAMTADMFRLLMKVLDKTKTSASFWFIHKTDKHSDNWITKNDFNNLVITAEKLQKLRNKMYSHNDKFYAYNESKIWHEANISVVELQKTLEIISSALLKKYKLSNKLSNDNQFENIYTHLLKNIEEETELAVLAITKSLS